METITEKQEKIEKKVTKKATAKKEPVKQEKPNKKAPKKPDSPGEWLQKYISEGELSTSAAKQVTWLLSRPNGASIKSCVERAIMIGEMKQSSWGKNPGAIKSHISFLKGKGVKIAENDGIYKIES